MENTASEQEKQSPFASEPIGKLILRFAIPSVIALLVNSLYNIVDQIFIGWGVGYLGNGATNVVFPITIVALALSMMIDNGGARNFARVKQALKISLIASEVVSILAFLFFQFFPMTVVSLFGSEEGLYNEFAVLAFRIYLSTVALCCVQKATSIFLQALGKPVFSLGLSLLRDFILSLPLILLLGGAFGVTGPLWSGPISDVVSLSAAVVIMIPVLRKMGRERERATGREPEGGTSAQAAV